MNVEITVPKIADQVCRAVAGLSGMLAQRHQEALDAKVSFIEGGPVFPVYPNHNLHALLQEFRALFPSDLVSVHIENESDLEHAAAVVNELRVGLGLDLEPIINHIPLPAIDSPQTAESLNSALLKALHARMIDGDVVCETETGTFTSLSHCALAIRNHMERTVCFKWAVSLDSARPELFFVREGDTLLTLERRRAATAARENGHVSDEFSSAEEHPVVVRIGFPPESSLTADALSALRQTASDHSLSLSSLHWDDEIEIGPRFSVQEMIQRYQEVISRGTTRVAFFRETDFDGAAEIATEIANRIGQPVSLGFNCCFLPIEPGCDQTTARNRLFAELNLSTEIVNGKRVVGMMPAVQSREINSFNAVAVAQLLGHPVACSFPGERINGRVVAIVKPGMNPNEVQALFTARESELVDRILGDLWGDED